ncbi:AAA family ATPase [Novipirellula sp. SH528]|uniref:AAA family ATPase n=1 Tax=Novipirellula sp. SH528 TaxID=3454466 RepID=UPI003FA0B1CF
MLDEIREEIKFDPTDDQRRVIQSATDRCREHSRAGVSFAMNATNLIRQTLARWTGLFTDYNAPMQLVYLEPSTRRLREQNRQRTNSLPESVVQKLAAKVEPPTALEAQQMALIGD